MADYIKHKLIRPVSGQRYDPLVSNPWNDLAHAIVKQALTDYSWSIIEFKKDPHNTAAQRMQNDVERFFRSKWFTTLTPLNKDMLIAGAIKNGQEGRLFYPITTPEYLQMKKRERVLGKAK